MRWKGFTNAGRLAATLVLLSAASSAHAANASADLAESQDSQAHEPRPGEASPPAESAVSAKHKWQFATIGYAWFAGAWGQTDVIGPAQPVDLDLPFGKVLKAFKFAFMGAAEARRDRLIVLGDLTFIHLDTHKGIGIRDPDFLRAELDSRTAEVTLLGGYRVLNNSSAKIDLLAGGRMNFFKLTLQLDGPNRSLDGSKKESWFDPLIATRILVPLGGKWSSSVYGDVGGFGLGSDLTWQGVASVDYQISRKMNVGAGWRYFKVNYDHGDFLYDVYQSGPVITFRTAL